MKREKELQKRKKRYGLSSDGIRGIMRKDESVTVVSGGQASVKEMRNERCVE